MTLEADLPRHGARAASRRRRVQAIVDAAVGLAERGGPESIRLRDVATQAGVSMGALYRCFDSKEEILLHALSSDFANLERHLAARPVAGDTELERVVAFFRIATRGLVERPHYARAAISAIASGQAKAVRQVAVLNARMAHLIEAAITGERVAGEPAGDGVAHGEGDIRAIARVLHRVWFSTLVGWAAGVHSVGDLIGEMRTTAALLLAPGGSR